MTKLTSKQTTVIIIVIAIIIVGSAFHLMSLPSDLSNCTLVDIVVNSQGGDNFSYQCPDSIVRTIATDADGEIFFEQKINCLDLDREQLQLFKIDGLCTNVEFVP